MRIKPPRVREALPIKRKFHTMEARAEKHKIVKQRKVRQVKSFSHSQLILLIAKIDTKINRQVNAILHHPRFQQLESSWRGLDILVSQLNVSRQNSVRIRILDVSYVTLAKDVVNSIEFDQSQLFKKIYTEEFDQPGGQPFGLLIGDYYFTHKPNNYHNIDGINVLKAMAKISAAAFAPFISSVAPSLFGIDSFVDLSRPLNLARTFQQPEYQRWHSLAQEEDARFIGLVLPQVLMRAPYNANGIRLRNQFFKEETQTQECYLWGNASYCFAAVAIKAFIQTGWFAEIHGNQKNISHDYVLKRFPNDYCQTDKFGLLAKPKTNVVITDGREAELEAFGFISLCQAKYVDYPVFHKSGSIQKAKNYDRHSASVNAKLSTMLHYIMCASRFAHYIKIIMRNKIGSYTSAADCESQLQQWLHRYCAASGEIASELKAKYPLREAKVEIQESAGDAGKYICKMHLQPHYQLDEIKSQLRLVTEVSK